MAHGGGQYLLQFFFFFPVQMHQPLFFFLIHFCLVLLLLVSGEGGVAGGCQTVRWRLLTVVLTGRRFFYIFSTFPFCFFFSSALLFLLFPVILSLPFWFSQTSPGAAACTLLLLRFWFSKMTMTMATLVLISMISSVYIISSCFSDLLSSRLISVCPSLVLFLFLCLPCYVRSTLVFFFFSSVVPLPVLLFPPLSSLCFYHLFPPSFHRLSLAFISQRMACSATSNLVTACLNSSRETFPITKAICCFCCWNGSIDSAHSLLKPLRMKKVISSCQGSDVVC